MTQSRPSRRRSRRSQAQHPAGIRDYRASAIDPLTDTAMPTGLPRPEHSGATRRTPTDGDPPRPQLGGALMIAGNSSTPTDAQLRVEFAHEHHPNG